MKYMISEQCYAIGRTIIKPEKQFSFLAYLITGGANILIDTLPERSGAMLLEEIASIIGEKPLDAIIMNHSEEDHSGALPMVLQKYPDAKVYCTKACQGRLSQGVFTDNVHTVHTEDVFSIGGEEFAIVETPGLHWDDNMVTFWKQKQILFSNDLFGQYAAAEPPIDDEYPTEVLIKAAAQYYDNVFAPATAWEKNAVFTVKEFPIEMIAPGHGIILNKNVTTLLNWYTDKITS